MAQPTVHEAILAFAQTQLAAHAKYKVSNKELLTAFESAYPDNTYRLNPTSFAREFSPIIKGLYPSVEDKHTQKGKTYLGIDLKTSIGATRAKPMGPLPAPQIVIPAPPAPNAETIPDPEIPTPQIPTIQQQAVPIEQNLDLLKQVQDELRKRDDEYKAELKNLRDEAQKREETRLTELKQRDEALEAKRLAESAEVKRRDEERLAEVKALRDETKKRDEESQAQVKSILDDVKTRDEARQTREDTNMKTIREAIQDHYTNQIKAFQKEMKAHYEAQLHDQLQIQLQAIKATLREEFTAEIKSLKDEIKAARDEAKAENKATREEAKIESKAIRDDIRTMRSEHHRDMEQLTRDVQSCDSALSLLKEDSTLIKDQLKYVNEKANGIRDCVNGAIINRLNELNTQVQTIGNSIGTKPQETAPGGPPATT